MKIFIGADHAGYKLKDEITGTLRAAGHEVTDVGTNGPDSVDYPDFAGPVARAVSTGQADRGILVCFTGVGMSMAANKVAGVRAALACNTDEISLTRQHNNANVLTIGSKYTTPEMANQYVKIFLETPFEGGRHERRVNKISALEEK